MRHRPEYVRGVTTHARRGSVKNAFRYAVDYVLIDAEHGARGPRLFSRNRFNLLALHDRDHGGRRDKGQGAAWAREVFAEAGLPSGTRLLLLAQPRFLGYWFNPVSFWMATDANGMRAVIAEVNNPFGDRHSYLLHNPDFAPIAPGQTLKSQKAFHVSPFQRIAGDYSFRFDLSAERIAISITLKDGTDGLIATLAGPRQPLTNRAILVSSLRRPAGALRTLALIYWQALKLKLKGVRYRTRPQPPTREVT